MLVLDEFVRHGQRTLGRKFITMSGKMRLLVCRKTYNKARFATAVADRHPSKQAEICVLYYMARKMCTEHDELQVST